MSRLVAFELLSRVSSEDSYANLLLPTLLTRAKLDSRDAAFTQELAFGTIRNQLLYDRIIEHASGRPIADIDQNALIVLRLGAHQLLDMRVPAHAAINETVDLAKAKASRSASGFVNAILRKISTQGREEWIERLSKSAATVDEKLSLRYSHPVWIIRALRTALDARGLADTVERLLASHNTPAKVSIATIATLSSPSDLSSIGLSLGPASPIGAEIAGNPTEIELVRSGRARVQDQGSQLLTLALLSAEIKAPDSSWLDMCAGPGGKAAVMAGEAISRNIKLECNEVQPHRLKLVRNALAPLAKQPIFSALDAREYGVLNRKFSRILLDAPCSGLGALRRRPESRWRKQPSDLVELSKLQRELILSGWEALEPGGVMAYVTCSPHLSETSAQVAWAESKLGTDLELINANMVLNRLSPSLGLDEKFLTAQLWPHIHGTDAMFIALFRKRLGSKS